MHEKTKNTVEKVMDYKVEANAKALSAEERSSKGELLYTFLLLQLWRLFNTY